MRKSLSLVVISFGLMLTAAIQARAQGRLPALAIDSRDATVSGISAGGFMAVQLHVAHSSHISGVGVVAGGSYWCAEGNAQVATNPCMLAPWLVNPSIGAARAQWEARRGRIDPVSQLSRGRVYLYGSPADAVINVSSSYRLNEFYRQFIPATEIRRQHEVLSAHGFPTAEYGAPCALGGYPWVLDCGFDLAGEILQHLYSELSKPQGPAKPSNLYAFDQTEFTSPWAGMATTGHVYVPTSCRPRSGSGKTACRVHVALHGCGMSPMQIGDAYYAHAGYNRWAEENGIIVLYPAVLPTAVNAAACWDWWGYTGPDYANQSGPQIRAIQAMIDRLKSASSH